MKNVATDRGYARLATPEAMLVGAIRLPELPVPSASARDVLALFAKLSPRDGAVLYILN